MSFKRQLLLTFSFSALALIIFWFGMSAVPERVVGEEEPLAQIILQGILILGSLVSFVMAVAFGASFLVWELSGKDPEIHHKSKDSNMSLGASLKGAALTFLIAMAAYASFFFI